MASGTSLTICSTCSIANSSRGSVNTSASVARGTMVDPAWSISGISDAQRLDARPQPRPGDQRRISALEPEADIAGEPPPRPPLHPRAALAETAGGDRIALRIGLAVESHRQKGGRRNPKPGPPRQAHQ